MGANATTVQNAYAAFGGGDIAAVLDMLTDDVDWASPRTLPHGGAFHGKGAVGGFFQSIGANWQALTLDVEVVGELGDDLVIGVIEAKGTRSSGTTERYGAAHVFTVRSGKIARFREYVDIDAALSEAGSLGLARRRINKR
jgi:ketosteroid isomerase-like protein